VKIIRILSLFLLVSCGSVCAQVQTSDLGLNALRVAIDYILVRARAHQVTNESDRTDFLFSQDKVDPLKSTIDIDEFIVDNALWAGGDEVVIASAKLFLKGVCLYDTSQDWERLKEKLGSFVKGTGVRVVVVCGVSIGATILNGMVFGAWEPLDTVSYKILSFFVDSDSLDVPLGNEIGIPIMLLLSHGAAAAFIDPAVRYFIDSGITKIKEMI